MTWYFECWTCDKEFPSGWKAREQHCDATGHSRPPLECDSCPKWFSTETARYQHMDAVEHFKDKCCFNGCRMSWPSDEQAKNHEIDYHHYCRDCDQTFISLNNIKMHMRSRAHLGQTIDCPFCYKAYTTATGLTHHLENGSCPQASHLDRDSIYRFVRQKDPSGMISKKLIGWTGSEQYQATNRTWNGYGYECYFCDREFNTLNSLNQHLNSPVHQQNLYHCPDPGCRQDFKNLAGIINHLESESCGFTRFDNVQRGIHNIVNSNRMLTF